jgi:hypothetical protein
MQRGKIRDETGEHAPVARPTSDLVCPVLMTQLGNASGSSFTADG